MWHYSWWTLNILTLSETSICIRHTISHSFWGKIMDYAIYCSLRTFDQKSSRLMHCLHCTCSMFAWLPSSSPPSFPHPFLDDYCCSRHHCLPPHNIGSEPSKGKSKTKWRPMKASFPAYLKTGDFCLSLWWSLLEGKGLEGGEWRDGLTFYE